MIKSHTELTKGLVYHVEFEKPIFSGKSQGGFSRKRKDLAPEEREIKDIENRKRSARRAAKEIRQKIRTSFFPPDNPPLKMVTLTYKSNMQDFDTLSKHWKALVTTLKPSGYFTKYITIVERQERGAFHLHSVSDMPFIPHKRLTGVWQEITGEAISKKGVWVSHEKEGKKSAEQYLTEYLTQEKYLCEIPKGKKRYFHSKNVTNATLTINTPFSSLSAITKIQQWLSCAEKKDFTIETKERGKIRVIEFSTETNPEQDYEIANLINEYGFSPTAL